MGTGSEIIYRKNYIFFWRHFLIGQVPLPPKTTNKFGDDAHSLVIWRIQSLFFESKQ